MKISMIAAALPPQQDGIGDYTARLAAELARTAQVSILTCQNQVHDPIPGVKIVPAFSPDDPGSCRALLPLTRAEAPDWVILQYNPFSYGKWGRNPHLPRVMAQIQKELPRTRVAVMAHETFVPIINARFAVMTTWQRAQFWQLGRRADTLFLSIDPWVKRFRRWFPHTPVHHLPVGSNIPHIAITRQEARARLGIAQDALVLGLFGGMHISRPMAYVHQAARAVQETGRNVVTLYIGPHGQAVREIMDGIPLIAEGPLPPDEVSRRFAAIDIYLAPFSDGISTRRTSLMTALQHGIAVAGTRGCHTDDMLLKEDGQAFLLSDADASHLFTQNVLDLACSIQKRMLFGREGQRLYNEKFAWKPITQSLLTTLEGQIVPYG